jgi:hypothetical protein
VELVDLEHAHADGVFTAIDTAMNNHGRRALQFSIFFSYWVPDGISNKWCKSSIRIDTMLVQ